MYNIDILLEYNQQEDFDFEVEYDYLCDTVVDDTRYDNEDVGRKDGFHPDCAENILLYLYKHYPNKMSLFTCYTDVCYVY